MMVGHKISWQFDGKDYVGEIGELLSSKGVTSDVYHVVNTSGFDDQCWVIKVPKEASDPDFLPEYGVLARLKDTNSVSIAATAVIENSGIKEALVIEYLPEAWLLESQFNSSEYLDSDFAASIFLAVNLFKVAYEKGIHNLDIKVGDFYWDPENKRFISLDWNRAKSIHLGEKEKIVALQKRLLGEFYKVFSGEKSLPSFQSLTINSESPLHWRRTWRTLRRTFLDLENNPEFPIQRLFERAKWLQTFTSLFENDPEKLRKTIEDAVTELEEGKAASFFEAREQLYDVSEYVLEKAHSEWYEFINSVMERVQSCNKSTDPSDEIIRYAKQKAIDGFVDDLLEEMQVDLRNIEGLSGNEKWKIASWAVLIQLLEDLTRIRGLKKEQYAPLVYFFERFVLDGYVLSEKEVLPGAYQDELVSVLDEICEAEKLIQRTVNSNSLDSQKQIDLYKDRNEFINSIEDKWPLFVVDIFRARTNLSYDLDELQQNVVKERKWHEKENQLLKFKERLRIVIDNAKDYPGFEIDSQLESYSNNAGKENVYEDAELRKFIELHELYKNFEWIKLSNQLTVIGNSSGNDRKVLIPVMWNNFEKFFSSWQNQFKNQCLYRETILTFNDLQKDKRLANLIDENLKNRIDTAKNALKSLYNVNLLSDCKEAQVEPWKFNASEGIDLSYLELLGKTTNTIAEASTGIKKITNDISEIESLNGKAKKYKSDIDENLRKINSDFSDSKRNSEEAEKQLLALQSLLNGVQEQKQKYTDLLSALDEKYQLKSLSSKQAEEMHLFAVLQQINIGNLEDAKKLLDNLFSLKNDNQASEKFKTLECWRKDIGEIDQWDNHQKSRLSQLVAAISDSDFEKTQSLFADLEEYSNNLVVLYLRSQFDTKFLMRKRWLEGQLQKAIRKWDEQIRKGNFEDAKKLCRSFCAEHDGQMSESMMANIHNWKKRIKMIKAFVDISLDKAEAFAKKNRELQIVDHQSLFMLSIFAEDEDIALAQSLVQKKLNY